MEAANVQLKLEEQVGPPLTDLFQYGYLIAVALDKQLDKLAGVVLSEPPPEAFPPDMSYARAVAISGLFL